METALSVSAIELVSAAHKTRKKKSIPTNDPIFMLAKTFGMVMNISEGPAPSALASPPEKANTAGIIISPAIIAMPVSNISTFSVEASMETFFSYMNQRL